MRDHISSLAPPPPLVRALYHPATMHTQPATQRAFSSIATSNSAQEDQAVERLRGHTPVQEQSAFLGVSSTHESDAHGIDVLGLDSMVGGGAYGQGYSGSIRRKWSNLQPPRMRLG